ATPDGGRGDAVGPHSGDESGDDDCKYHVKVSVPCVRRGQNLDLTVTLTTIGTTTPATGADPQLDATLGSYPLANTNAMTREANGVYTITPIRFDRSG